MNFTIVLSLLFVSILYNFWNFLSYCETKNSKLILLISFIAVVAAFFFTIFRVRYAFRDGFGQSDLITNWTLGLFVGIAIGTLFASIIFLVQDVIRLILWLKNVVFSDDVSLPERRRFVRNLALGLASIPISATLLGMIKGKYDYKVRLRKLAFDDFPKELNGFKIVQFSDLHSGSYDSISAMERALKMIQDQAPDLIVFTGDWINAKPSEIVAYKHLFKQLHAPYGKYAVLGNHDYGDGKSWANLDKYAHIVEELKGHIADMGFQLLNNENAIIQNEKASFRLVGVENWGRHPFPQKGDLNSALQGVSHDEFTVLLSHDPTHWEQKTIHHQKHIHLTMSGHTHGAQFGIDSEVIKWSPVQYVYKRWAGLYEENGQFLYVNRGLGFIGYAGRIGIRPEISVFELSNE